MPISATEVAKLDFLSLLVIGQVRTGKTQTCLSTGQALGHWYVFCCDADDRLRPAAEATDGFTWDPVNASDGTKLLAQFEAAMAEAMAGIKAGKYQGVMFDTVTSFAFSLFHANSISHKPEDTRALSHDYNLQLQSRISRFAALPCHKICVAHVYEVAPVMQGQLQKVGPGILPNVEGGVRTKLPGLFQDVVYFDKDRTTDTRSFVLSIPGVFGPASSNAPGIERCPADVGALWEHMKSRKKGSKGIQTVQTIQTTQTLAKPVTAKPVAAKPAVTAKPAK